MKKKYMKLTALSVLAALCLMLAACGTADAEPAGPPEESPETSEAPAPGVSPEPSEEPAEEPAGETEPLDMSSVLFIGDSRTVGLYEYAGLPSDFFADAGMSVYNIFENYSNVGDRGFTQLRPLLEDKDYSVIFLMLGLNEIGFPFDEVMEKFGELVDYLRDAEPDSKLVIMANLHVTTDYSDGHPYINNPNINDLNGRMAEYADGEDIFYLDVSGVYDDETGGLDPELTSDGVHFYAKHYQEWGEWISREAAALINQ